MHRTHLRYECADSFGSICSSGSAKESIDVCFHPSDPNLAILPSLSHLSLWDMRSGNVKCKVGHREDSSFGTQRALNSGESTCVAVSGLDESADPSTLIASGWVDGSVRVFNVKQSEIDANVGTINSLVSAQSSKLVETPLTLTGHSGPITSIAFDDSSSLSSSLTSSSTSSSSSSSRRVASGGADGAVVIWDILSESGLFKLLGHKGPITSLKFAQVAQSSNDSEGSYLLSSSLDGFIKVWDLNAQCCVQTITGHRSEVWCMDLGYVLDNLRSSNNGDDDGYDDDGNLKKRSGRMRLISGASDAALRMWDIREPVSSLKSRGAYDHDNVNVNIDVNFDTNGSDDNTPAAVISTLASSAHEDDVAVYLGCINRLTNERCSSIKFHPKGGRVIGVSTHGGRTVEIYAVRTEVEAGKKRNRRLRRRREKAGKETAVTIEEKKKKGKNKKGVLDDDDDDDNDVDEEGDNDYDDDTVDVNAVKTGDELVFACIARTTHKIKGFAFAPIFEKGGGSRLVIALATNGIEVHSIGKFREGEVKPVAKKLSSIDMYGHPSPVRCLAISSDDTLACSVGKGTAKVWNVENRSCVRSLPLNVGSGSSETSAYGLCCAFIPDTMNIVVGTKEGSLMLIDYASGDVLSQIDDAHGGAIWSLDVHVDSDRVVTVLTGSADKEVKFWEIEIDNELDNDENDDMNPTPNPTLVHVKTLKMNDDVVCVKFSYSLDPSKLLVFVSSLDSTIKVFFNDTLKFFLSLYGHKLPALAVDCSSEDAILASGGADKTIKIWGLDFGDCHRSLHGHTDSITSLRFVNKTHNLFSASKDKTVRYWDADRFEQILLLSGHVSEVQTLYLAKSGGYLLTAGMDRQVRVWERTKDMVFVEEEREKELEKMFDKVNDGRNGQVKVGSLADGAEDAGDEDADNDSGQPQSEAAVKKSIMSVAAGDRILEAVELADSETQEVMTTLASNRNRASRGDKLITVRSNPLLMGMDPPKYILWVLKSIKVADLEQALLILPIIKVERLVHYMIELLRKNLGTELCAKATIFLVKTHQKQIVANQTMAKPLHELRVLLKERLAYGKDTIGVNLAGLRAIAKSANEKRNANQFETTVSANDIWGELGLGSDVAAALSSDRRGNKGGVEAKRAKK